MCNQSFADKIYVRDYEPDFSKLKNTIPPDIYLITKEKLSLPAHKIVLARDDFWKELIMSMSGVAGVCPSEPLTVFLPDFQYKTVKLMLRLYYTNEVGLNKDEHDSFLQLIRSFNPNIGLYNGKCRICSNEVSQQNILDHVLLHIKASASKDITHYLSKKTVVSRCSFTHPQTCTIESDRKTVVNGIFNDERETDMEELIKEHYRRHLRDEISYLRKTCGSNKWQQSDEELYQLADINADNFADAEFLRGVSLATGHLTISTTDRVEDVYDDYSGGMSSPESETGMNPRSVSGASSSSSRSPEPQTSHANLKGNETNLTKENKEESADVNQRSKSGGSRRSSMEEETSNQIYGCNHCSSKIKSLGGFRKHYVSKHIYKELEKMIMKSEDIDLNSLKCTYCKKSEDREKVWPDMKIYVPHMALVHKVLDKFLQEKNDSITSHYKLVAGSGKTRNLSGVSLGSNPRSPSKSRKSDDGDMDSDDSLDAMCRETFTKKPESSLAVNSEEGGESVDNGTITDNKERIDESDPDTEDENKEKKQESMESDRDDKKGGEGMTMGEEEHDDSDDDKETLPPDDLHSMDVDA